MQARQLLDKEEQEKSREKAGSQKALRMVQEAHSAQRNKKVIFVSL